MLACLLWGFTNIEEFASPKSARLHIMQPCGEHEESTLHALWNYVAVQPIWDPDSMPFEVMFMSSLHSRIWYVCLNNTRNSSSSWLWHGSFGIEGIKIDSKNHVSLLIRFSRQHKHYFLSFKPNHEGNLPRHHLLAWNGKHQA